VVTTRTQLDRIGDDLPADERRAHALRAHGDAVRDRDGIELEGCATGLTHARLHVVGEPAKMKIAGPDLNPGVRNADQRARQVVVCQTRGFEHGPGGGPGRAVGHGGRSLARQIQSQGTGVRRRGRKIVWGHWHTVVYDRARWQVSSI
jgi:hypothetical protein